MPPNAPGRSAAQCPERSRDRAGTTCGAARCVRFYDGIGSLMQCQFDVIIERDSEAYYVASVPQLPGCHTQANSLDIVIDRIREAISLFLEVVGNPSTELEFVGIRRVTI